MHRKIDDYFPPVSDTGNPDTGAILTSPISPTLAMTPRTSELRSHSQTEPYLRHEPELVITEKKKQFLRHLFPTNDLSVEWNLDLSDLRYDSNRPREAEGVVAQRLNKQILSSSQSTSSLWKCSCRS